MLHHPEALVLMLLLSLQFSLQFRPTLWSRSTCPAHQSTRLHTTCTYTSTKRKSTKPPPFSFESPTPPCTQSQINSDLLTPLLPTHFSWVCLHNQLTPQLPLQSLSLLLRWLPHSIGPHSGRAALSLPLSSTNHLWFSPSCPRTPAVVLQRSP